MKPAPTNLKRRNVPRLADRLLEWFVAPYLLESLQGDLHEEFAYQVERVGERRARWRYWRDVLGFLQPRFLRRPKSEFSTPTNLDMLRNYLTIALRNLAKNKVYSVINSTGLSIGLACAMLIVLYVQDEVSYDRFHKNVDNIYRIARETNGSKLNGTTGFLQGPRFTQHVPGIKTFVRVQGGAEAIKNGTDVQVQNGVLHVDTNFLSVLTFPLVSGNQTTCLLDPNSIVVSEDVAKKYFATTDVIGRVMMVKEDTIFVPYKVTAVTKRCPQNSSVQFDALMPLKVSDTDVKDTHNWFNSFLTTFVVLDGKANFQTVEKQMQLFYVADAKQTFHEMLKNDGGNADDSPMGVYFLQPYLDMHFSTGMYTGAGLANASNPMYSYLLLGIALFILLIACINFVNLTIARSAYRSKEIGIRKVMGSDRKQLVFQFLGESFLLCTVSFVVAIALTQLVLPLFSELANKALVISYLIDIKIIAAYFLLYTITGFLAGFYPAFVLSGYNPVQSLYSRFKIAGENYFQKALIVFQFTMASFLIIAAYTIYAQFNFLTKADLGYDDNNVVIVNKSNLKRDDVAVFKNELLKNPDIVAVSVKNDGERGTGTKNKTGPAVYFSNEIIDEDYFPLLKVPLVEGRNFSAENSADFTQSVIVNESFVKASNWKKPIGENVTILGSTNDMYHVIGVVKDYHFASLTKKITPQLFTMNGLYETYYIKIKPNTEASSLKWIQKVYQRFYPMSPYNYLFKNDENRKQYADVDRWKQVIFFGATLAIFISCIGLFGLSVLCAERRVKEIGIRKVLGASISSIVSTLSLDFIKLVFIALAIAIPFAWMATSKWLQEYPYRITLGFWLFASAGLVVIAVALLTTSFQSIRAALMSPVKSLRSE